MRVAALTGPSGSGKTTLVVSLISHYLERGSRVAAIKHTHHLLNDEDRGDTRLFRVAGAEPVILAAAAEAVLYSGSSRRRITWSAPADLLQYCSEADVVLVEGFKGVTGGWPQVPIDAARRPSVDELARFLDRIWCEQ